MSRNNDRLRTLREICGERKYSAIVDEFGGSRIYIPTDPIRLPKELRNESMMYDFLCGMTYEQIADKYYVDKSTVYRVIKSEQKED